MVSQLIGAVVRAVVVFIVIATPSLLIPWTGAETIQVVMLLGAFAAFFTFSEYFSSYPALIEFRDAAPFNRIRILVLFITLFTLSVIGSSNSADSTLLLVISSAGLIIANALDFVGSPLSMLLAQIPADTPPSVVIRAQAMIGVATFVGLFAVTSFAILTRLQTWPRRKTTFNVWINLPTFDPTRGGDIVTRLIRESRVNILLGFLLPFVGPVSVKFAATHLNLSVLDSTQALVWTIALWMFLPVNMFMRGMAMARVADMISAHRRRLVTNPAPSEEFVTA